jgi:hypothetical protein
MASQLSHRPATAERGFQNGIGNADDTDDADWRGSDKTDLDFKSAPIRVIHVIRVPIAVP